MFTHRLCLLLAATGSLLLGGCGLTKTTTGAEEIMVLKKPLPGYSQTNSGDAFGTKYVGYETSTKDTIKSIDFNIKKADEPMASDKRELKEMVDEKKAELMKPRLQSEGTLPVAGRSLKYQIVKGTTNGEELTGTIEPARNNLVVTITCSSAGGKKLDLNEVKEVLACVEDFAD